MGEEAVRESHSNIGLVELILEVVEKAVKSLKTKGVRYNSFRKLADEPFGLTLDRKKKAHLAAKVIRCRGDEMREA